MPGGGGGWRVNSLAETTLPRSFDSQVCGPDLSRQVAVEWRRKAGCRRKRHRQKIRNTGGVKELLLERIIGGRHYRWRS